MNSRALTPVVLAVGWLISLALVFGLGVFLSLAVNTQPRDGISSEQSESLEMRQVLLSVERLTGQPMNSREWASLIEGTEADAFMVGIVRLLIATRENAEREFHTRSLSSALPLSMQAQVLRIALAQIHSPQRDHILQVLLHRWGMLDGRSAVTFVRNQPLSSDREPLLLAALRGWSSVAPRDAWSWLGQQEQENRVQAIRRGEVVHTLVAQDTAAAFSLLQELQSHAYYPFIVRSFFSALLEISSPDNAALWLDELPRGVAYAAGAGLIASAWAGHSMTGSLNWVRSLEFQWQPGLLQLLAGLWAETDPVGAVLWATQELQSGLLFDAFIQKAGVIWLEDEGPASIANWLNANPSSSAYDTLATLLVQYTSLLDPTTALVWAGSIRQPAKRDFWIAQVRSMSGMALAHVAPASEEFPMAEEDLQPFELLEDDLPGEEDNEEPFFDQ